MARHITLVVLLGTIFGVFSSDCAGRSWTDRKGRKIEGDFVAEEMGKVKLRRKSDGKTFALRLELLSDADQKFVKSHRPASPEATKFALDKLERVQFSLAAARMNRVARLMTAESEGKDLQNVLEKAQQMAAHASSKTTNLYNRTSDSVTLDEVERILI